MGGHRADERVQLIVPNEVGLHARPAAMLVKVAQSFEADIRIACNGLQGDAKSMMGVLLLGAEQGMTVTVTASGSDAAQALRAITGLFARAFGEMEREGTAPQAVWPALEGQPLAMDDKVSG